MNSYSLSAIVAMLLFMLGTTAILIGIKIHTENKNSVAGRVMLLTFLSVFMWNYGYGWMSLCYDDEFAYVPRALALMAVFSYMAFIVDYVSILSNLNKKILLCFNIIYGVMSVIAWLMVIQKGTVNFVRTKWGYWYTSSMSFARIFQFITVIMSLCVYFCILFAWKKKVTLERERAIIRSFELFGPIMLAGYLADTLIPSIAGTAAVPGSAISAFISALLLYGISNKYRAMGASISNVAEYVFREVKVPVLVTDMKGSIVLNNTAAAKYIGKSDEELYGLKLDVLFEKEKTSSEDIFLVNGKDSYCRLDTSDVYDKYGAVLYNMIFISDMTQTMRTMENMENSRKDAEEANIAKSNFLANMSHEIRTPMNAIIGITDILLQENSIDNDVRESLEKIKDASDGLLVIINDILDISKIESGKYELVEEKYDIPSLINDVTNIISVKLQETAVELDVDVDDDIPVELYGDETKVRQILLNILGNSVKFTTKGSIGIRAYCEKGNDICKLMFDISDTGIGIKDKDIGLIFGEFSQVDTRKNRKIQGSGLGLAISKRLAELMGGDITVESTYGEGSTFHITLTQKISNETVIGEKVANTLKNLEYKRTKHNDEFDVVSKKSKRILVVDDMPVNILVTKGLLKPYEVMVDEALSGQEAIEKIQENDYDLVFMDHMMPEMDGVDATRIIRELPGDKYRNLIIVALTANSIADARDMLINSGMDDFLAKPVNKAELNEIINKWL